MSAFGGKSEKCWVCNKSIYAADPNLFFEGKIHKGCARCKDCSCTLNLKNIIKFGKGDEAVLVCDTHNKARVYAAHQAHKGRGGKVRTIQGDDPNSMSEAMQRALENAPVTSKEESGECQSAISGLTHAEPGEVTAENAIVSVRMATGDDRLRALYEVSQMTKDNDKVADLVAPGKGGLLHVLAGILKDEDGAGDDDSKLAAAGVVWNLSVTSDNRPKMVSPEHGMLDALAGALASDQSADLASRSLGALHNISLAEDAQQEMGQHKELVNHLVVWMGSEDDKAAERATGVVWNLATCEANRIALGENTNLLAALTDGLTRTAHDEFDPAAKALVIVYYLTLQTENRPLLVQTPGLVAALSAQLDAVDTSRVSKAAGIFVNLSCAVENKEIMASPAQGMVVRMVGLLNGGHEDLASKLLGCLWNLSACPPVRPALCSPDLHLIDYIARKLVESIDPANPVTGKNKDVTVKCCIIVQNLAGAKEHHGDLRSAGDGKLIAGIINQMLNGTAEVRPKAFGALLNISLTKESAEVIGHTEGAFKALKQTIEDPNAGDLAGRACGVMQNMSIHADHRVGMPKEPGLLQLLLKIIGEGGPLRKSALALTVNLSNSKENKSLIFEVDGIVDVLQQLLKVEEGDTAMRGASLIWSLCGNESVRNALQKENELIELLTVCAGKGGDLAPKAMGALSNIAPGVKV